LFRTRTLVTVREGAILAAEAARNNPTEVVQNAHPDDGA
jgi:hypothetical protein